MEALGVLLVPLAIGYFIAPIAAFFMALGARSRINDILIRLAVLERRLGATPAPAAAQTELPVGPTAPPFVTPVAEASLPQAPPAAQPEPVEEPAARRAQEGQSSAAVPQPPSLAARTESLEQIVGTRWVVWVGGLALALGGIFLVSYAVEQGFVGPGVRITLAAILAAALIASGEWARRSEKVSGFVGLPSAHVPSILTAAGTTVAYATVYAAFALYGFLGPAAAFALLGVVAIATLAAALLHGPALAALGIIGAEVTPLLVSAEQPNYWALYIYLAVVTAAAVTLARVRLWRWLAVAAVVFGVLWTLPGIDDPRVDALAPHMFHVIVGFGLAALVLVSGLLLGPAGDTDHVDGLSSGALAIYLVAGAVLVDAQHHDTTALLLFAALVAATVAIAWRTTAAVAAVPAAAVLTALVMVGWAAERELTHTIAPGGLTAGVGPEPVQANVTLHFVLGFGFAGLFGGTGFLAQGRSQRPVAPMLWAAASVFVPIAIVAALYYRLAGSDRSLPFAALSLLAAALFGVATEQLTKHAPRPGSGAAQAIYATGAIAALALALTMALEKGWLTVGLALMVPGIAWVERKRPLAMLRWLAATMTVIVVLRIGWEPRIVGGDVGATPIFNWLLYGYGGPALAFWVGGALLRRRADDVPGRTVDAAAILFTVLLAFLEIRHYVNRGDIYRASAELTELALQVCVGLAMTIGLERLRHRTNSIVHNIGAIVVGALTLAATVVGLWILENPMFTGDPVGPPYVNLVLLGYGAPAVLGIILALVARTTRPLSYRVAAAGGAIVLSLLYFTLEVARLFQGPVLTEYAVSDAQQYTYSAVWLAYGVVLLVVGLLLPSKPARLASAAVIFLTVVKVFLLDMADLQGIWRALSFIGLGLVLVGIGYLYQRLLFPPGAQNNSGAATAAPT